MPDPSPRLSPGKARRLARLAGPDGRFAMLAIDQRRSLFRQIADAHGRPETDVATAEVTALKRAVLGAVAPRATAVLVDPLFGWPHAADVVPPGCGVIVAGEQTGYDLAGDDRRSRPIPGWSVARAVREGADAVKLLVWHHPEASAATHAHQQAFVEAVGAECAALGVPLVLEVVTYPRAGARRGTADWARRKPALVADAAARYGDPRFGVDLLKLEFPADLRFAPECAGRPFASGEAAYAPGDVEAACAAVGAAAAVPWVILSGGVDPDEFAENVRLAAAAGASGFLCGRAVWKPVVDAFPDAAAMRAVAERVAAPAFEQICAASAAARPWTEVPAAPAVLAA